MTMATLALGVDCELLGDPDCPCGPCVWNRFIVEDPFGAAETLEVERLLDDERAYRPPIFVRGLLQREPWMDWFLLTPPHRRRWMLEGPVFSETFFPDFCGVFPGWAWKALREEGEAE